MSPTTTPCRLCTIDSEIIPADMDGEHRKCGRCGEYKITGTAIGLIGDRPENDKSRIALSGWVRNQNILGDVPFIGSNVLKSIGNRPIPSVAERADLLLLEIVRSQLYLDEAIDIEEDQFMSVTYSVDDNEVRELGRMLAQKGLIRGRFGDSVRQCLVNLEGHTRADELRRRPIHSALAFVAMRFSDDLTEAYDRGITVAVLNAGYEPVRVDRTEHVNRIDDEIIARIRASAFVISDFTEHSPGVYFEAGFGLGLGLPVIWTCRKDHMEKLHFDIRQYNCIDWESHEDLAARLQLRIEAIAGKGPKASLEEV